MKIINATSFIRNCQNQPALVIINACECSLGEYIHFFFISSLHFLRRNTIAQKLNVDLLSIDYIKLIDIFDRKPTLYPTRVHTTAVASPVLFSVLLIISKNHCSAKPTFTFYAARSGTIDGRDGYKVTLI